MAGPHAPLAWEHRVVACSRRPQWGEQNVCFGCLSSQNRHLMNNSQTGRQEKGGIGKRKSERFILLLLLLLSRLLLWATYRLKHCLENARHRHQHASVVSQHACHHLHHTSPRDLTKTTDKMPTMLLFTLFQVLRVC